MVEEAPREVSEFNSAVHYINRINAAWGIAGDCKLNMEGFNWACSLSIILAEVSTKMRPEELLKFKQELKEIMSLVSAGQNGKAKGISHIVYWRLFDLEVGLRQVCKEAGLETKFQESMHGILMGGGR